MVTPGEVLGRATKLKAGKGAYVAPHNETIYASLTGFRRIQSPPPDSTDQVSLPFPSGFFNFYRFNPHYFRYFPMHSST